MLRKTLIKASSWHFVSAHSVIFISLPLLSPNQLTRAPRASLTLTLSPHKPSFINPKVHPRIQIKCEFNSHSDFRLNLNSDLKCFLGLSGFHSSPLSVRIIRHKQQKPTYSFKQKSYKKQMGSSEFLGRCGIKLKLSTKNNALSWATVLFRKFILVSLSLWRKRAIQCLHSKLGKSFSACVVTYGNVWNSQSWWIFYS